MKEKQEKQKCKMCREFGWWPVGRLVPIGEMDSEEWPWEKIIQCPWCGSGGDNKSERYKSLKKYFDDNNITYIIRSKDKKS